jgi:hypothetical protein
MNPAWTWGFFRLLNPCAMIICMVASLKYLFYHNKRSFKDWAPIRLSLYGIVLTGFIPVLDSIFIVHYGQ